MGFSWNIIGQENIINNLTDLREKNVLPNSFIFTGLDGIGKSTLAYHLINYIFSKNEKYNYDTNAVSYTHLTLPTIYSV